MIYDIGGEHTTPIEFEFLNHVDHYGQRRPNMILGRRWSYPLFLVIMSKAMIVNLLRLPGSYWLYRERNFIIKLGIPIWWKFQILSVSNRKF